MKKLLQKLSLFPDKTDYKSLFISYIIINFTFLYHTLNFMWGNHDVKFIKEELLLSSGLFEGRFTQFIPYRILTNGQILPLINNLLGFAFLTTALWLLAKYWNLKKSTLNYTLFISFFATQPYTLSWLYFTFITISCLLWCLVAILGLYLSTYINTAPRKLALSISSILCFYITLGGYPPVINLFFVALCGKLIFSVLFENKTISELFNTHKYTLLNIILACILFKITLKLIAPDNVYNLESSSLSTLPVKLYSTIIIAFRQFLVTVPFMEKGYKITLFIMSLTSIICAIATTKNISQRLTAITLIFLAICSTGLTTFIATAHTEYVSRIDFYGFGFLYALFLAILLNLQIKIGPSLAILFMIILIPYNIINNYRAQKVWKLGFDAEFNILEQVYERIETSPYFNPKQKYRFYQIGDISYRPAYYLSRYNKDDVFLLSIPYIAIWQGSRLLEFYSPFSYIDHQTPILPSDITPEIYYFLKKQARPWPHPNSIFINNSIIIIIYNQAGLDEFQKQLNMIYP